MESDILCQRDGAIATVTLINPDKLNALNARMWSRLRETFAGAGHR
jgi:enoyl-CoA hydratase/carnithine racemase